MKLISHEYEATAGSIASLQVGEKFVALLDEASGKFFAIKPGEEIEIDESKLSPIPTFDESPE